MIHYRIDRPINLLLRDGQPNREAWAEIGLGHMLPIDLTDWALTDEGYGITRLGRRMSPTPSSWYIASSDVSIGFDHTPGPVAFQRDEMVPGMRLDDVHGNQWLIPNANPQSALCTIPEDVCWTSQGAIVVHGERYAELMALCVSTFEAVIESETIDYVWAATRALEILQFNYRIGALELSVLGQRRVSVVDRDFALQVIFWFIDFQLAEDVRKKKALAG